MMELQRRHWLGNVRELRHAVEHALVVARAGVILPHHLPKDTWAAGSERAVASGSASPTIAEAMRQLAQDVWDDTGASGSVYERWLSEVEPPLLAVAMNQCQNECAPAAHILGLHRTTLRKKLERYGLSDRPASS